MTANFYVLAQPLSGLLIPGQRRSIQPMAQTGHAFGGSLPPVLKKDNL
jgi:hypothetical protein